MKKVFLLFFVSLCFGAITVVFGQIQLVQLAIPGDGVLGHGPALRYTDNGNGTFTDNNTALYWEIKTNVAGSVHNVNNTYTWSNTGTAADGTLFTVFLNTLNHRCDGDETKPCMGRGDCTGIGNGLCGLSGMNDWCIPNVKKLQTIVNYSKVNPASSVPGATAAFDYWSATTNANNATSALIVYFGNGIVNGGKKSNLTRARAVRYCYGTDK